MADAENEPLLLPVGHYLGPVHPGRNAPPSFHVVRLGWEQVRLSDQDLLETWLLCHGMPTAESGRPWTRTDLLAAAEVGGLGGAEGALEELLSRGLAVEVRPGAIESVGPFARSHRLEPLLVGLGHDTGRPLDVIGVPGLVIALEAWPRVFELWQWAHLWPDLWSAGHALAEAAAEAPGARPDETDPMRVLAFAVGATQTLVMRSAAYLDVKRYPAPARRS